MRLRRWFRAGAIASAACLWALAGPAPAQDCTECHGEARFGPQLHGSAHAGLKCAECHTDLAGDPHRRGPGEPGGPRATAAASCARCHEKPAGEFERSAHAAAIARGSKDAPTCASCHGAAHGISPVKKDAAGDRTRRFRHEVELCGRCHEDQVIVRKAGLNGAVVETYETSMHGARARLGYTDAATCTDCHGRHAIAAPTATASPLHIDRRAEVCATCHPGADRNFAAAFEHRPATREAFPVAWWTKQFFTWLLVLTSGALALHTFLDVQAQLRARILRRRSSHAR